MNKTTKTNGWRPHLGIIAGRIEQDQTLDLSVVGHGMRVVGRIHSSGAVKVGGTMLGDVRADQVLVAEGGRVEGDVFAREVVLGGEVRGSVVAEERVEVEAEPRHEDCWHGPAGRYMQREQGPARLDLLQQFHGAR